MQTHSTTSRFLSNWSPWLTSNSTDSPAQPTFLSINTTTKPLTANKRDSGLDFGLTAGRARNVAMDGAMFVKSEPSDYEYDLSQYAQYQGQNFNNSGGNMHIDPTALSNSINISQVYGRAGQTQGPAGNNGHIGNDDLEDLEFNQDDQQTGGYGFNQGMRNFIAQQSNPQGVGMFSHTPDGAPIQSPFTGDFNYSQFRFGGHSMPQQTAIPPHMQQLDVKPSLPRSTANTPGMSNLHVNDDFSRPGMRPIQHRQQQSNGFDSTSSHQSLNDASPFVSPSSGQPMHNPIHGVMRNNSQTGHRYGESAPVLGRVADKQSDAKRRKRRESHNLVERRRRDNINERIQDLGQLVPQHRLEDEKVRKHLQSNAPLSPSITHTGPSPPNPATSGLAGPGGRRAASGGITQGLPVEEKDKAPNKGDILNGSVTWVRDLLWYLQKKSSQEQQIKQHLDQMGVTWPFENTDEDNRMLSEIAQVINVHHGNGTLGQYSRGQGSGLRVPPFTNLAGESLNQDGSVVGGGQQHYYQQAMSPGFVPGGSGMSSGRNLFSDLKEEEEFDNMDDFQDDYQ